MSIKIAFVTAVIAFNVAYVNADVSHLSGKEDEAHANPYVFSYQAGRAPGHVDRQHTEVSDGSGVVRGAFSYVDPKNQVRTVQYVADETGFHPQLSHATEDVEAVKLAKQKHINLYNRIAQEHANAQAHNDNGAHLTVQNQHVAGPRQSQAVLHATQKHLTDFERIAAEHAAIGAQHDAERQARLYEEEQLARGNDPYHIPVAVHYE